MYHVGYTCDLCGQCPIIGTRFNCSVCDNWDCCMKCKPKHNHSMTKYETAVVSVTRSKQNNDIETASNVYYLNGITMISNRLELDWTDCFVLLNVAQYLNGQDIYSLKSSITDESWMNTQMQKQSISSLEKMFDNVVKQLVSHRLSEFQIDKNQQVFEMSKYFVKYNNKSGFIRQCNDDNYWIYDMIGGKEPSLDLIDPILYQDMGKTEWKRDDHRTFLTTEIFINANLFLIINILETIKKNNYSLTNCRHGSSVNQIDKILLKLVLSFGKNLKNELSEREDKQRFIAYNTKFLEFAYFYLNKYIPYIRYQQFQHKILNRAIHFGDIECVKMLRTKCKAPININSDPNVIFEGEQRLFQTFRNAQYCMNIWSLMVLQLQFNIDLFKCLKQCYDINEDGIVNKYELIDMNKLETMVTYFMKPDGMIFEPELSYDKNEEILKFWLLIKKKEFLLVDRECVNFVNLQIELYQQSDTDIIMN